MRGQERILREQFAQVACVECGAEHQPDDMLVLAQRGSRWLVLLTCRNCKRRGIFVASFERPTQRHPLSDLLDGIVDDMAPEQIALTFQEPTRTLPTLSEPLPLPSTASISDDPSDILGAHSLQPHSDSPVTPGDVENIRHFLNGFDGNFRALFGPVDD